MWPWFSNVCSMCLCFLSTMVIPRNTWGRKAAGPCSACQFGVRQFEEEQLGVLVYWDHWWDTGDIVCCGYAIYHTSPPESVFAICACNFQADWKCREDVATQKRLPGGHWQWRWTHCELCQSILKLGTRIVKISALCFLWSFCKDLPNVTVWKVCVSFCVWLNCWTTSICLAFIFLWLIFFFSLMEEKRSVNMSDRKEQLIANYQIVY